MCCLTKIKLKILGLETETWHHITPLNLKLWETEVLLLGSKNTSGEEEENKN